MFLFELDQNSAKITKIIALTSQLKDDIDNGEGDPENFTVDDLLEYFQLYDVILDRSDLYNMIKVNPLKSLVSDIKGNRVIFKGYEDDSDSESEDETDDQPEDEAKKTVEKMAKSALKK